jgi:cytidylate kinase
LEVAARAAARLGLKIVRSEIVADSVAERLGIEPKAFLRHMDGAASIVERWRIDRRRLVHCAAEEILRVALQDNVLIKGWGAATLLRGVPQVISVRICAPMDFRVRVLMHRFGVNDPEATRAQIERHDAARARTMTVYFNVEQEDPRLYHLVLNTERLSIDACVKAIAALAESPRFSGRTEVRSALADKLMEARISLALTERISPTIAPLGVSVSVADGRITLHGTSCSGSLRGRAESITHELAGGLQIDNRIVSVPSHGRPPVPIEGAIRSCKPVWTATDSA